MSGALAGSQHPMIALLLALQLAPRADSAIAVAPTAAACASDLDCSLNGVCTAAGACVCDRPWKGPVCGVLGYKVTPASGRSLFPHNTSHNTWNGPILGPDAATGAYHLYAPYYGNYTGIKSLFRVDYTLHGVADRIEGPYTWLPHYDWTNINPAALAFPNRSSSDGVSSGGTNATVFTLWDGAVMRADTPGGPWSPIPGHGVGCGGNPAPAFDTRTGAFYCTNQHTLEIFTTPALGEAPWTHLSDVNLTLANGSNVPYARYLPNVEDPFLWVDRRGSFHIINHRYVNTEYAHCGTSTVSAHVFSPDGLSWHIVEPAVEPYGHTVQYDDGTSTTFATLERPNIHFDASGQMTHINFAADLTTPDAGCNDGGRANKQRSCAECKFYNHCGTTIVALDV